MNKLHVLIADDSPAFRSILADVMAGFPEVGRIHHAVDGVEAIETLKTMQVNLVLLDLDMPRLGGLPTLRLARQLAPDASIVVISGLSRNAADLTLRAIEAGALDFVVKPRTGDPDASRAELGRRLAPYVKFGIARRDGAGRRDSRPMPAPRQSADRAVATDGFRPRLVAIGASTGAPGALVTVASGMPSDFPLPILLVVHLPAPFTDSFARYLGTKSTLPVHVAEDGMTLAGGAIHLAKGDRHLEVRADRQASGVGLTLVQTDDPPVEGLRPSFDVLLESLVQAGTTGCVAVIMTGLGRDGTQGIRRLKGLPGNLCVVQDPDTCIAPSMPRNVINAGLADHVVPLLGLADRLQSCVTRDGRTST